ncbi:hypothetical protein [Rhizohabitans arisaemae]|uniref:hypothetical protein n=1 Tax=Rhizohabitans arisaemae TaxID=2720610 RepID=UPI0024B156CE|nr:hypothetical protein [Rhizohabitans arisaemae]
MTPVEPNDVTDAGQPPRQVGRQPYGLGAGTAESPWSSDSWFQPKTPVPQEERTPPWEASRPATTDMVPPAEETDPEEGEQTAFLTRISADSPRQAERNHPEPVSPYSSGHAGSPYPDPLGQAPYGGARYEDPGHAAAGQARPAYPDPAGPGPLDGPMREQVASPGHGYGTVPAAPRDTRAPGVAPGSAPSHEIMPTTANTGEIAEGTTSMAQDRTGGLGTGPAHHEEADRPFVTAAQISGPKTPPAQRQHELYKRVFEDDFDGADDDAGPEHRRRVWPWALVGSTALALVAAIVIIYEPFEDSGGTGAARIPVNNAGAKASATPKPTPTQPSSERLPRYPGRPSPVVGRVADAQSRLGYAALGTPWQRDQRTTVRREFGFTARQYIPAGTDHLGQPVYAHVMSGTLDPSLAGKYAGPDDFVPVINAAAYRLKLKFSSKEAVATRVATQRLTVDGHPGGLIVYNVKASTLGESSMTMLVAAIDTGAKTPSILYISIPDNKKRILPDIHTVLKSLKVIS